MHNNKKKQSKQTDPEMREIRIFIALTMVAFFVSAAILADPDFNVIINFFSLPMAFAQTGPTEITEVNATAQNPDVLVQWVHDQINTTDYSIDRGTGFNLTSLTHNQVIDITAQNQAPEDVSFSPDGLKMYMVGIGDPVPSQDFIYEYDLSTAWDISSASFLQKQYVNEDESPQAIFLKPDGTKIFVAGVGNSTLFQYTLSPAYDITSLTLDEQFTLASAGSGLLFSTDGSKFYITVQATDTVIEYTMSVNWDVSTAVLTDTKFIGTNTTVPRDIAFSLDGRNMIVIDTSPTDHIDQYTLTQPFNVSTATYDVSEDVGFVETQPEGFFLRIDNQKLYLAGGQDDEINEFNMTLNFNNIVPSLIDARIEFLQDDFSSYPNNATADLTWVKTIAGTDSADDIVGVNTTDDRIYFWTNGATSSKIVFDLKDLLGQNLTDATGAGDFNMTWTQDLQQINGACANLCTTGAMFISLTDQDVSRVTTHSTIETAYFYQGLNPSFEDDLAIYLAEDELPVFTVQNGNCNNHGPNPNPEKLFFQLTKIDDTITAKMGTDDTYGECTTQTTTAKNFEDLQYLMIRRLSSGSVNFDHGFRFDDFSIQTNGTLINLYKDTNVDLGTTYLYRVTPFNLTSGLNGTGVLSNAVLTNNVPAIPTGITAQYSDESTISVDWDDQVNLGEGLPADPSMIVTEYRIYDQDLGGGPFVLSGTSSTSDFELAETFPQEKEIMIQTCNQVGCGANSTIVQASVVNAGTPSLISDVNATAQIADVLVEWVHDQVNTTDYFIERGTPIGWNITTMNNVANFTGFANSTDDTMDGFFIRADGKRMFIVHNDPVADYIDQFSLSTAWDMSTLTFDHSLDISSENTVTQDIFFKPDGTVMATQSITLDELNYYTLSTAWDISTATLDGTLDIEGDQVPRGLWVREDGLMFWSTGTFAERVIQHNMTVAWDFSTAILDVQKISVAANSINPNAIEWRNDGLVFLLLHESPNDQIDRYDLSVAWDISTAVYNSTYDLATELANEDNSNGIQVKSDGITIFTLGNDNNDIKEWTLDDTSTDFETIVESTGLVLQHLDTTVDKATNYIYKVTPFNEPPAQLRTNGTGTLSNAVLTNDVPAQVLNLIASYLNENQITLDWDDQSDLGEGNPASPSLTLVEYRIYDQDLSTPPFVQSGTSGVSNFIDAENFPQEKEYKISACNELGCGANSTVVSVLAFPLSTPVLSASNNVALGINATWTNAIQTGITQYSLFNSSDNITFDLLTTTTNGTLFFFDTPHGVCFEQYYKVRAETATQLGSNSSTALGTVNCVFSPVFTLPPTLENIGDTFKVTGSGTFSGGNLTQIALLENGTQTDVDLTGINFTTGPDQTLNFNYLFWERETIGGPRNFTVAVSGQSPLYTIATDGSSAIGTSEYSPQHFDAIVESQGKVNYTHVRFSSEDDIQLKVNRIGVPAGETWQIECIYQNVQQAIATKDSVVPETPTVDWVGDWHNTTNTGFFNSTYKTATGGSGASGSHVYISCFNDELLFSTTSFTNSSLALFGIEAFDVSFGSLIGIPSGIFMLVLMAGMANKRTSPTWIVVITGAAGLMSVIGFFSLDPIVWGLALITAMLGMFVNQKVF
jgi:hypothetical protein